MEGKHCKHGFFFIYTLMHMVGVVFLFYGREYLNTIIITLYAWETWFLPAYFNYALPTVVTHPN